MTVSAKLDELEISLRCNKESSRIELLAGDIEEYIEKKVEASVRLGKEDSFIVTDLSKVLERHRQWMECFPDVRPFFAVKAQNNLPVRALLTALGCGFDCASLAEITDMISCGVNADDIIYAQPYKQVSHLRESLKLGIVSVCDVPSEIRKVGDTARELGVKAKVVIRILPLDGQGIIKIKMSSKYGAPFETLVDIVNEAKGSKVDIIGVSFHVGSQCYSSDAYQDTLVLARQWWDELEHQGCSLTVLDIGGGFPGGRGPAFKEISCEINLSLQENFGDIIERITTIAEPGRYMVTSSQTVVTSVIARKGPYSFVLSTGVYGGFNNYASESYRALCSKPSKVMRRGKDKIENGVEERSDDGGLGGKRSDDRGEAIREARTDLKEHQLKLWGPTCDGADMLSTGYDISGLDYGDWIAFPDQGAYGSMTMTSFNGFQPPEIVFVCSKMTDDPIKTIFK